MSSKRDQLDAVIDRLQIVRDDELEGRQDPSQVDELFAQIVSSPVRQSDAPADLRNAGRDGERSKAWNRSMFRRALLATGCACALVIILALGSQESKLNPPVAAAGIEIEHKGKFFVARVVDINADPAAMRAAFAEHGFDIRLRFAPAPASGVGEIVGANTGERIKALERCDPTDVVPCRRTGLRIPEDFKSNAIIVMGREAEPGERYFTPVGAFRPGEPLHCSGLFGRRVSEARGVIADRDDVRALWRVEGRNVSVPPDEALDYFIHLAFAPKPGVVLIHTAAAPPVPREGFTVPEYRDWIGRGC